MPETIQILSRRKFAFKNPDKYMLKPAADPKPGVTDTVDMSTKLTEIYFETIPNKVQTAPKWVINDDMFAWALKDGDIMVIDVKAGETRSSVDARAEAQQQQSDSDRLKEEQARSQRREDLRAELDAMNKADLIEHAKDVHGLDLSPAQKKDDLVDTLLDAKLKDESASASAASTEGK